MIRTHFPEESKLGPPGFRKALKRSLRVPETVGDEVISQNPPMSPLKDAIHHRPEGRGILAYCRKGGRGGLLRRCTPRNDSGGDDS